MTSVSLLRGMLLTPLGGCRTAKRIRLMPALDPSRPCYACLLVRGLFDISRMCSWLCMFRTRTIVVLPSVASRVGLVVGGLTWVVMMPRFVRVGAIGMLRGMLGGMDSIRLLVLLTDRCRAVVWFVIVGGIVFRLLTSRCRTMGRLTRLKVGVLLTISWWL